MSASPDEPGCRAGAKRGEVGRRRAVLVRPLVAALRGACGARDIARGGFSQAPRPRGGNLVVHWQIGADGLGPEHCHEDAENRKREKANCDLRELSTDLTPCHKSLPALGLGGVHCDRSRRVRRDRRTIGG